MWAAAGLTSIASAELPHHLDLIVASRFYGSLIAVDRSTGMIRSIVTGTDVRDLSLPVRGSGTALNGAQSGDIGISRDGRIFWKLAPTTSTYGTYQVDPVSGNRSGLFGSGAAAHDSTGTPIVWNAKTLLLAADGFNAGSSGNARVLRYGLPAGPTTILSGDLVGDGPRTFRARYMAAADATTVFVAETGTLGGVTNNPGIFRIDLQSGARTFISRLGKDTLNRKTVTGGVLSAGTTPLTRGTGPVINGQVRSLLFRQGKLYIGASSQKPDLSFVYCIIEVNPATGNRTLVVGTALVDDGTGTNFVSQAASNAGAPPFDSPSGMLELPDSSIAFTSLFSYNTILRLMPETRELTMLADLGPQIATAARGNMQLTSMAVFSNCDGDLNLDGFVDDADFSLFVAGYDLLDCADPAMKPPCAPDINGDLFVDDADFSRFVVRYDALVCE